MEPLAATATGALERAIAALDAGELIVLTLDEGEALCADALDEDAARRLILASGRSADAGVPLVVAGFEDIQHVAFATPLARALADAFWPGPLTMTLRARPWIPDAISAAQDVVAVTAPAAPFARDLARRFGPFAALPMREGASARLRITSETRPARAQTWVDATGDEAKVLGEGSIGAAEVAARGR